MRSPWSAKSIGRPRMPARISSSVQRRRIVSWEQRRLLPRSIPSADGSTTRQQTGRPFGHRPVMSMAVERSSV